MNTDDTLTPLDTASRKCHFGIIYSPTLHPLKTGPVQNVTRSAFSPSPLESFSCNGSFGTKKHHHHAALKEQHYSPTIPFPMRLLSHLSPSITTVLTMNHIHAQSPLAPRGRAHKAQHKEPSAKHHPLSPAQSTSSCVYRLATAKVPSRIKCPRSQTVSSQPKARGNGRPLHRRLPFRRPRTQSLQPLPNPRRTMGLPRLRPRTARCRKRARGQQPAQEAQVSKKSFSRYEGMAHAGSAR